MDKERRVYLPPHVRPMSMEGMTSFVVNNKMQKEMKKDRTSTPEMCHASLNTYDYLELEKELVDLIGQVGSKARVCCKTFYDIYEETASTMDSDYPGRHLPFAEMQTDDRTVWRYQCLRIMDEIFQFEYEDTDTPMEDRIVKKYREITGKKITDLTIKVTEDVIKKNRKILDWMVSVNRFGYSRYGRNTFKNCGGDRQVYKSVDGLKLSAFMVTLTVAELKAMSIESHAVLCAFFGGDREKYRNRYPLMYCFIDPFEDLKNHPYMRMSLRIVPYSLEDRMEEEYESY